MSHNLNYLNGRHSFFCASDRYGLPWHNLGQIVDQAQTWQNAIQLAQLNWTVSKRPLFSKISDGNYQEISSWGIFRDDNGIFLGSVGKVYEIIQNKEAFDFVDTLLEQQNGAHYETAGALGNGERIFVTARIPYDISPDRAKDDISNCFLLFETSHDGSISATAKLTTVRVVCNNTLNVALSTKGYGQLKVKHSESGHDKLDQAKKLITGIQQSVSQLKEKFNILAKRKVTQKINTQIMERLFGQDWKNGTRKVNQVEKIAKLFESNDGNKFPEIKGTAYNLLQAITNYSDHDRSVRSTEGKEQMTTEALQAESALFGSGETFKAKALEYILQETECSELLPDCPIVSPVATTASAKSNIDNILSQIAV